MKILLRCFLLGFFVAILIAPETGLSDENEKVLKVGVSQYEPCAFENGDGVWRGFSVDLWKWIANYLGFKYEFVPSTFKEKLNNVLTHNVDLAIGGISVTAEREKIMNFSKQTMPSGQSIVVLKDSSVAHIVPTIWNKLVNKEMIQIYIVLFTPLFLLTYLFLRVEKDNPQVKTFSDALWFSWQVRSKVIFGDVQPLTSWGRNICKIKVILGSIIGVAIMAPIISAFSVRDIEASQSRIQSALDLRDKVIATKADTFAAKVLGDYNPAEIITFPDINGAYDALLKKEVEAVVYDTPGIMYFVKKNPDKVMVVGARFARHSYGFAYPQDSGELEEKVNQALLKMKEEGAYDRIYEKWFGQIL